ncbi:MAG: hypothetical protein ACXVJW_04725 [Acidimicrobiia bacterium]
MGFQLMPYQALVHVTYFDANQIVGTTPAGEQIVWRRDTFS